MNFIHLVVGLISDEATLLEYEALKRQSRHGPDSHKAYALQSFTMGKGHATMNFPYFSHDIWPLVHVRPYHEKKKKKKIGVFPKKRLLVQA
jgi:hypothetical protein